MIQNITADIPNPLEKEIREAYEKELINFIKKMKCVDIDKIKNNECILSEDGCSKMSYRVNVESDIINTVKGLINLRRILDFYDELDYSDNTETINYLKMGMFEP